MLLPFYFLSYFFLMMADNYKIENILLRGTKLGHKHAKKDEICLFKPVLA